MSKAKFGTGHPSAMGRLGWRELRNAASPSRDSIAADEMGLYGTATPGEVADQQRGINRNWRQGLGEREAPGLERQGREQSGPELEM